ncbi:ABC transporter ATP-binding protein [Lihuaxuella thermophila]|uniref:ABC-2 type transport system ATP-binding protein n=1 Tax=Lihuaxuella thermophila TaxID=1173111 RepID=A0A1H8IG52_9BACL|nr:ABC transporter ATP-binding protein [Lihuaxuella thermophila]SEN67249.1 ABC-2 type transport system ATP-binding protein [Lihuaxuella thermophila]
MEKVLEMKGLTKCYRNGRGIFHIDLTVYKGDIFGLFGPNGAGKTTLIKAITGLCSPDQGEVHIFGYEVSKQFEKAMEKVGCIVETGNSFEYMTAFQNLQMISRFYPHISSSRIDEVLELAGLKEVRHEKVKEFSSGMKQRLALAAALFSHPELVILDEPTSSMDIEGMIDFRNIVKKLAKEEQVTFFICNHSIHEMERMCNRIGILYDGKLIASGLASDMMNANESLEDFYMAQIRKARGMESCQFSTSM